jgi:Tol biopolymer transport system component
MCRPVRDGQKRHSEIMNSFKVMKTCRPPALMFPLVSLLLVAQPVRSEMRILFCSDKAATGSFDLFTIKPDGTDLRQLTTTPAVSEWAPALSPDGTQLAFVNRSAGSPYTGTLQLMPVAGGAATAVPVATTVLCVQWQDASTLVYMKRINTSGSIGTWQLRRIKTDGTGDAQIYSTTFDCFVTGCDSFHLDRNTGRVYIADLVNGGQPSTLLSGLLSASATDTTFTRCTDVDQGTTQVQLVDHYDPMVSPDGIKLAYCADHGSGRHRLYVRPLGNDCTMQIRLSDTFCGDPDWSWDSSWIAFTRATASSFGSQPYIGNIYTVGAAGGTPVNLTGTLTTVSGRCAHPLVYSTACEAVELSSITKSAAGTTLSWPAVAGGRYQVQYSNDLTQWLEDLPNSLLTANPGTTSLSFTDAAPDVQRKFYRVRGVCP